MEQIPVLVALRRQYAFDQEAFLGVARAGQSHGNLYFLPLHPDSKLDALIKESRPRGIICSVSTPQELSAIVEYGLPCVNIANYIEGHARIPVVGNDDAAIGRMAAQYYLDRGFKCFAYAAEPNIHYFDTRRDGYISSLRNAGFECHVGIRASREVGGEEAGSFQERFSRWIAKLPRPIAVMCPYDGYALNSLHGCKLAELRVPEEVSILGVDDDPVLCLGTTPQISSVKTAGHAIGFAAFELLSKLMAGKAAPAKPILIPPTGVVDRGSTVGQAIFDPDVAAAANYIRTHVRERLSVDILAEKVLVSRKTLHRKFVATLGRSPSEEIQQARLDVAKGLLRETDLSLAEVARRSGLLRPQRLANIFSSECDLTPTEYRKQFRETS